MPPVVLVVARHEHHRRCERFIHPFHPPDTFVNVPCQDDQVDIHGLRFVGLKFKVEVGQNERFHLFSKIDLGVY